MSADPTTTTRTGPVGPSTGWLPARVDGRVRFFARATLVVQIGIVGTGGLVRLTGSRARLPHADACWDGVPRRDARDGHPRDHRVRQLATLTFLLAIIAVVTFVLVVRMRRERRDLFWPRPAGRPPYIPLQAVLGGIHGARPSSTRTSSGCTSSPRCRWSPSPPHSYAAYATPGPRAPSPCRAGSAITTHVPSVVVLHHGGRRHPAPARPHAGDPPRRATA